MYVISHDLVAGRLVSLFDKMEAYLFGVYAIYPHSKQLSRRVRVLVNFLAERFRLMYSHHCKFKEIVIAKPEAVSHNPVCLQSCP